MTEVVTTRPPLLFGDWVCLFGEEEAEDVAVDVPVDVRRSGSAVTTAAKPEPEAVTRLSWL